MNLTKEQFQEVLVEARRKARRAKEVTNCLGYEDFQEWVKTTTALSRQAPIIHSVDSLIAYVSTSLFNAGVSHAAQYFTEIQKDPKLLEEQYTHHQKDLKDDLSEWDIDDADED